MKNLGFKDLQQLSFRKIQKLQEKKFRSFVRYLLPHVPFYGKLFETLGIKPRKIKKIHDWQDWGLPLVKKSYFRTHSKEFILTGKKHDLINDYLQYVWSFSKRDLLHLSYIKGLQKPVEQFYKPTMLIFSGGTRGTPAPMILTHEAKFTNLPQTVDIVRKLLKPYLQENMVGMNLFPYAPHLAWHSVHLAFDMISLNMNTAAGGFLRTKDLVRLAQTFQPNMFSAMNDYFLQRFLKLGASKKLKLPENVLYINGSIPMTEENRTKIKKAMKKLGVQKPVALDFYAATEFKESLFPECREKSGFHHITPLFNALRMIKPIYEDDHFVYDYEFVEGKGIATLWNLGGAGSVLHGYIPGDYFGKVTSTRCRYCKLNVKRIYEVERV